MTTEIQDEYAEAIYGTTYNRCTGIEKHIIDTIIRRRSIEKIKHEQKGLEN
jgi:hypothetical protein